MVYDLLEEVLQYIEINIKSNLNIEKIAKKFYISNIHLQRIFKFTFNVPIIQYIRQRKLAVSIDYLLNTNMKILDIAYELSFEYEQTYIRAFKKEFLITPGEFRHIRCIVNITPTFSIQDYQKSDKSDIILLPEYVMIPTFHTVGKLYRITHKESADIAPRVAKDFFYNKKGAIKNIVDPNVYIGLTKVPNERADWTYYMPSVQVSNIDDVPKYYTANTINAGLYVKFKYIGNHHYTDINARQSKEMYDAIHNFYKTQSRYVSLNTHFELIDTSINDDEYCMMEWYGLLEENL